MYYFLEQKYTIEKYFVSFSKEELEKLKIEIINKMKINHNRYQQNVWNLKIYVIIQWEEKIIREYQYKK